MSKIYLVLDIGTSFIKCGCIDSNYNVITQHQREFPMTLNLDTYEIDFGSFYNTACELITECLTDEAVNRFEVEALLITSQAQTFTAVDQKFQPLCNGIVWLDERAEKEAVFLNEQLPDFAKVSGFKNPLASLYISKMLWLKRNKPDIYKNAAAFPLINEYLAYKLTGEFYSDSTSFGMGGMYDYRRSSINTELLTILGLTETYFPKIDKAAVRGEMISKQIQHELNLDYRFPVYLCGNDQGASACGAGLKQSGDLNINFGTAMVFYTITDSLVTNLTDAQIAGKHPVGNDYFLLNFESDFGIQIRQLKNKYFKNGTYDQLFETYINYPDVIAEQLIPGEIAHSESLSIEEKHKYCAGIIKHYLLRLKYHLKQIRQAVTLNNITVSGGLTKSKVWLKILEDTLDQPFTINNSEDAGLVGAVKIYLSH